MEQNKRNKVMECIKNAKEKGISTREIKRITGLKNGISAVLLASDMVYEETIEGEIYYFWIGDSNRCK